MSARDEVFDRVAHARRVGHNSPLADDTGDERLHRAARGRLQRLPAWKLLAIVQDREPADPVYAAADRWLGEQLRKLAAGHAPTDPDAELVFEALFEAAEAQIRDEEEREVRYG